MTIKFYKPVSRIPRQATKAISTDRAKRNTVVPQIASALKSVWRDSLSADERGETVLHDVGSAVAIVAFICLMVWILGTTPAPGENRKHDVLVTTETRE